MKMKKKAKIKTIEDAILEKFPKVSISEIRRAKFGTRILGVVPAKDEWDGDHIVEWTEDGTATECKVSDRDYREVGWNEEEGKPEYIKAKLLIHNELFNVQLNGSK